MKKIPVEKILNNEKKRKEGRKKITTFILLASSFVSVV